MEILQKRDARKLSADGQEEIRRQAIKMHINGAKNVEISIQLEVHRSTVSSWVNAFKKNGIKSIKAQKVGRKPGSGMQLSEKDQRLIQSKIIDKNPDQLKLPFALWTREAVGLLIKELTGKMLDLRQVGRYLKRWGFTPQRPKKQAYQRNDVAVKKWLEEDYPAIKKKAKEESAEIHWLDETGIKSHDHRGRGYAPKGKTPIRKHNPCGEKVNQISALTNQGKLRFMCFNENFNYRTYHKFLKRLIEDAAGKKIHVIADNLRVHHSKVIKRWAKMFSNLIELHYLPSYSPDLNPDEYLNCDLKTELAKRPERRQKGEWKNIVEDTMNRLANEPERLKKYFKAESIKYAG